MAIGLSLAIFLPAFTSVVYAQGDNITSSIEVTLEPGYVDEIIQPVNIMDESSMRYEKDAVFSSLPSIEGKYYGPYLESSIFQFQHIGGWFQFATNFTIGADTIMNGASRFWVRVPILPTQYVWWHLWCSWGYYNTIEGIATFEDYTYGALLPWYDPDLFYLSSSFKWASGNVWSTVSKETYQIKYSSNGLFVRFDGIFPPGESFTMAFTGVLKSDQSPIVFLSQERQNLDETQKFRFFQPYEVRSASGALLDFGYQYDNNETIPLAPSWAFVFTNGIGKEGLLGYNLEFRREDDFIQWGNLQWSGFDLPYPIEGFNDGEYLSFYMPFSAIVINETNPILIQNAINWKVNVTLGYGYEAWSPIEMEFATPTGARESIEFYINSTENFILFSTPYPVTVNRTHSPTANPNNVTVGLRLTPMQQSNIVFMGSTPNALDGPNPPDTPWNQVGIWAQYWHEDERASWNSLIEVNAHILPLYNSFQWTDGRWAQINESALFWVYDFGWGIGYSFPGETTIYMFLDNGGEYFYNGSYQTFAETLKDDVDWWTGLVEFIRSIAGVIWDGILWIYEGLKSIGNWLWAVVTEIVGWLVSIAKDIAGKVSHIVEGLLYGVPMIVILFLVTHVGSMLNTGHLPKISRARRWIKKIRRPGKKVYRKVKYARELAQARLPMRGVPTPKKIRTELKYRKDIRAIEARATAREQVRKQRERRTRERIRDIERRQRG